MDHNALLSAVKCRISFPLKAAIDDPGGAAGDVIAMIDADGSADPGEIPKFVHALVSGADFAKGTRFAAGGGSSDITRLRSLGHRLLGAVVNRSYGTYYSDLCYGFNVFWQKYVPVLDLDITSPPSPRGDGRLYGDGFEIETLIHLRVADQGLDVVEVPSFEHPRIHGVSNLDAFGDGLRVLTTILVERRRARRHRRSRRRAPAVRIAAVQARGLIHVETAFVRMLYALHSIEPDRRYMHRGRSRLPVVARSGNLVPIAVGVSKAPSRWPRM
jgi:Glycosyl transferase family 2